MVGVNVRFYQKLCFKAVVVMFVTWKWLNIMVLD